MAKNKQKGIETTDEIVVSKNADVIPAEEKAPDQSVLDKPKPKLGLGLMASWKHAGSRNK